VITDKKHILHIEGINFTIGEDSCAIAMIGESGVGKTTIFKSLFPKYIELWSADKRFRFSAEHSFNGKTFNEKSIQQNKLPLRIGFANQLPYFLEEHTASENIFFPLKWKKANQMSTETRKEYLDKWELSNLAKKPLSILSGGQRQMVNLARSIVIEPDALIIDECFSAMNDELAEWYITFLKNEYSNICFIITSHRKSDIEKFECTTLKLKKEQTIRGYFVVTAEGS
jgi:ABC-type multidrug transport system ATPase subunit